MSVEKHTSYFESTNGCDHIAYYIYEPGVKPRAVVQLVHGMCEYTERYEDFIEYLCANGILVCGHDHLGHGNSAATEEFLGYFAREKGWQYLIRDTVKMTKIIQEKYPAIPYFIIGHSMGSLVVRGVVGKHSYLYDGAILLGTPDAKFGSAPAMFATKIADKLGGERRRSELIYQIAFGLSNMKIENPVNEFAWLSRDTSVSEKFKENPLCSYKLTTAAYEDLVMLIKYVSRKEWVDSVPKGFPVLVSSGSADPVGKYGKSAEELFRTLETAGCEDIELKLYNGARHELLNETNRAEVFEDLLGWLNYRIYDTEEL